MAKRQLCTFCAGSDIHNKNFLFRGKRHFFRHVMQHVSKREITMKHPLAVDAIRLFHEAVENVNKSRRGVVTVRKAGR